MMRTILQLTTSTCSSQTECTTNPKTGFTTPAQPARARLHKLHYCSWIHRSRSLHSSNSKHGISKEPARRVHYTKYLHARNTIRHACPHSANVSSQATARLGHETSPSVFPATSKHPLLLKHSRTVAREVSLLPALKAHLHRRVGPGASLELSRHVRRHHPHLV